MVSRRSPLAATMLLLLALACVLLFATHTVSVSASSSSVVLRAAEAMGPAKSFRIGPYKTIHPYAPLSDPEDEDDEAPAYPYYYKQPDGKWTLVVSAWNYRIQEPHPKAKNILSKKERLWQIRDSKLRALRRRLGVATDGDDRSWDDADYTADEEDEEARFAKEKKRQDVIDKVMSKINRQNQRMYRKFARLLRVEKKKRQSAERKLKRAHKKEARNLKRLV